jgi:hypothetical protein
VITGLDIDNKTPKPTLELDISGKEADIYANYFWTDGLIIGVDDAKALKTEIRTYDGIDFLIVETGSFGDNPTDDLSKEIPKDFHCGYFVYMRAKWSTALKSNHSKRRRKPTCKVQQ